MTLHRHHRQPISKPLQVRITTMDFAWASASAELSVDLPVKSQIQLHLKRRSKVAALNLKIEHPQLPLLQTVKLSIPIDL
jgi:hypothetical protein